MSGQIVKDNGRSPTRAWLQYAAILLVLSLIVLIGYSGFRAFAGGSVSTTNLYLLAVVAGVASFFSPCAFPLLPSYLSFYYAAEAEESTQSEKKVGIGQGLKLGLASALGVMSFALVLGLIIALLGAGAGKSLAISGAEPNQFVRIFRGVVGVVLFTLGVFQLTGRTLKPKFVDAFAYRTRPQRNGRRSAATTLYLYGLGYNAAGMGCTGPILAGLMLAALTSGGFTSAITAFAIFASTMGVLMLIISILVAASRQSLIANLKAATPKIKWMSSILLLLVGLFNIYTALNLTQFVQVLFP
jgi:cytochrome c-type biogenesis protein